MIIVPPKTEGAGNAGRPMHPQPCVRKVKAHKSKSPQVHRTNPALPARMVLTVSFVVSPETGLCCLRRRRDATHLDRLDTSVGVSGRYDFAVRASCVRLAHDTRPPHPAPNVRDDREAPLFVRRGMARIMPVIWDRDQHSRAATFQHDGQIRWRGKIVSRFLSFKHKQSNCFAPLVHSQDKWSAAMPTRRP
jgi:hypothetical protein